MAPFDAVVARLLFLGEPWTVAGLEVVGGDTAGASVLQLRAEVRRSAADTDPAARVRTQLQVGAVAETPLLFFSLLLIWPSRSWQWRLMAMGLAAPVWLLLQALATTLPLADDVFTAAAILAGAHDPLTALERWSRFLESGGRIALAISAALLTGAAADGIGAQLARHRLRSSALLLRSV
jgi:hypothetical protein